MSVPFLRWLFSRMRSHWIAVLSLSALVAIAATAVLVPPVRQLALAALDRAGIAHGADAAHRPETAAAIADDHDGDEHGDNDHDHEAEDHHDGDHRHVESETVRLSPTAQANVGLKLATVELGPFERTITVPGIVVERPGQTNIQVAAPWTGVVTRVWPMQGESLRPGQPLFELRLTHEEVVAAQTELLRTAENLDVLQREIDRLEKIVADGLVPGKSLLELKYEQQKLQAALRTQRQCLLLHGISTKQIDAILQTRTLLGEMTVVVPQGPEGCAHDPAQRVLQVEELKVEMGQHVQAGDPLCVLADHCLLFIQGKAFEQDAARLNQAIESRRPVAAVVEGSGPDRQTIPGLPLLFVANKIEPQTRAVLFYVQLPNTLIRNHQTPDGHCFSAWQFKPGQRVELLVPVERWDEKIVLPINAVVQDGPEWYVFENNAGHFDRRAVRVEHRDQFSAVIANDGALAPGAKVIVSGAYQVHLAMKNKAGGAPDPHAGHNH